MPPQYRRFLPLLLIVAFAFLVIPALTHRSHKSGLSGGERARRTIDTMTLVQSGEQTYRSAHGRFTQHLADLVASNPKLADDIAIGIDVRLDVSTDGQSLLAQVTSDVLGLVRARTGNTVSAHSCLVLKNSSGVKCPQGS